jgi:threonine dehydrogenase-like Zn-dependent dehydrogenase
MEAHGSPVAGAAHQLVGLLPDAIAAPFMKTAGIDRLNALHSAIDVVRRGGTISLSGVYGGMADPMPMLTMFDKQVQLRMGQANVWRWVPEILPLLTDGEPVRRRGVRHPPRAAGGGPRRPTRRSRPSADGMIKTLLRP